MHSSFRDFQASRIPSATGDLCFTILLWLLLSYSERAEAGGLPSTLLYGLFNAQNYS
jgi:hypothetical protein